MSSKHPLTPAKAAYGNTSRSPKARWSVRARRTKPTTPPGPHGTDWDIAINRYSIRTNSGEASSTGAKGGVYTFDSTVTFDSVAEVPAGATFSTDKAVTSEGMGGTTTTVKSEATVILFKTDAEGNKVMPPVYLQAPVYLFRSADGNHCYKVLFTQYQDENKESGHVIFSFAEVK